MDLIQQASADLLAGRTLDVTPDIAIEAIARVVGSLMPHITPTQIGGRQAILNLRKLTTLAGLPESHAVHAWWIALRALNPAPGETIEADIACPATPREAFSISTIPGMPYSSIARRSTSRTCARERQTMIGLSMADCRLSS